MQLPMDWIRCCSLVIYLVTFIFKQAGGARDELPEFVALKEKTLTRSPGERAVLQCKINNLGTKTVSWRRKDATHPITIQEYVFSSDKRFRVDHKRRTGEWNLVLEDVKPEDKGEYVCVINSKSKKLEWSVKLNVKKKIKINEPPAVKVIGKKYFADGQQLELRCHATGNPEDVEWFRNDEKIETNVDTGTLITKNLMEENTLVSVLVIKHSNQHNAGTYKCRSTNGDQATLDVKVLNNTKDTEIYVKRGTSELVSRGTSCRYAKTGLALTFVLVTSFLLKIFPLQMASS